MKVLYIARSTLYSGPGGDTVQIENTAQQLGKLGVEVDIKLSNESIDYNAYDLLHFFNVVRPADILGHISATNTPYVISTIYVDYREYDQRYRGGLIGMVTRLLGSDMAEYLKAIARSLKNGEKINSRKYLFAGHARSIKYVLKNAACLLPNSQSEYNRLVKDYGVENKYAVIPNAIDKSCFYREHIPAMNVRSGILCVARIDQYKNQLNLIRAVKDTGIQLRIAGKPAPNHVEYYESCVKEAENMDNVEFLGHLSREELVELYLQSRVHVLPSWIETTGLSSLEAAALGCALVISAKGDQKEYFEDFANYCEPEDVSSIRTAILKAYNTPPSPALRNKIIQNHTWERTAEETLKVYKKVLEPYNG